MQEKHLFEYAVIRVVPRVEREEFINVGIILYCSGLRFLKVLRHIEESKIRALCGKADIEQLNDYLTAFEQICAGGKTGGFIGSLPIASRFRWLTATRSSVVQTSKVHPGFCVDADVTLKKLYDDLVL